MGDENSKPQQNPYENEYAGLGVQGQIPKTRSNFRSGTTLPTLQRHNNIRDAGGPNTTSLHQSMGFQQKNKMEGIPSEGFTRKASENYCMDFRRRYSSSKENCILQHFADSLNRNNNV